MDNQLKLHLDAANKLIFVRDYEAAETILEALRKGDGQNEVLVHLRAIELAMKLGKLKDLRKQYLRELKTRPEVWPLNLCLLLIEIFGETTSYPSAITQLQDLMKDNGPHPGIYFAIGFCLEAQHNYDRAIFNYNESVTLDANWYPSYFGLSQVYYHKSDDKNGDHYFYLFENLAPYNVYGNFETHRKLCEEFTESGRLDAAAAAIRTLGEWWAEHRGACPPEIMMYEKFMLAALAVRSHDEKQAEQLRREGGILAQAMIDDETTRESQLYFAARVLDEFKETSLSLKAYKRILRSAGSDPAFVQKIGGHFLSQGDANVAVELFEEAYQAFPDNPDVRFCLLVGRLRRAGVPVEDYLIGKERLRQLIANAGDKVEILSLLHALLAKFQEDSEVHGAIADVYLRMGHIERANRHFSTMYELDRHSRDALVKYASFLMHHGDPEVGIKLIDSLAKDKSASHVDDVPELNWIRATYYARKNDHRRSQDFLDKVVKTDPWNVAYVVQETINLTFLSQQILGADYFDRTLSQLSQNQEADLPWSEFDQMTESLLKQRVYDVAYSRQKLRYLYSNGSNAELGRLTLIAGRFDASRGVYDVLRLLNTNFDSPALYWALGQLFKELWQLETALMWLTQATLHPQIGDRLRGEVQLEMADCNCWLGQNLERSVEICKFSLTSAQTSHDERIQRLLAHCYLRLGQVQNAQNSLDQLKDSGDPEVVYLNGLVQYRNGSERKAREIWKPLLTVRSESLRFHHLKQEMLRYYFESDPYLKAN